MSSNYTRNFYDIHTYQYNFETFDKNLNSFTLWQIEMKCLKKNDMNSSFFALNSSQSLTKREYQLTYSPWVYGVSFIGVNIRS